MTLDGVALTGAAAPDTANAAGSSGFSAFNPTGTGNPQNFNIELGQQFSLQGGNFGRQPTTGQTSNTGSTGSTPTAGNAATVHDVSLIRPGEYPE